nr:MAG TPA: hypothetical protein [Caudoviricetes sp.]
MKPFFHFWSDRKTDSNLFVTFIHGFPPRARPASTMLIFAFFHFILHLCA